MFGRYTVYARSFTILVGAVTCFTAAYAAVGLPIPATRAYVDQRIASLLDPMKSIKILVLNQSLDQITASRAQLRNEKLAIENTIGTATAPPAVKMTMSVRLSRIDDDLKELDKRDGTVRVQLQDLAPKGF